MNTTELEMLRFIHAAVVVYGADTQILGASVMAQQLLGLTEEQMLNNKAIESSWYFFRQQGEALPLNEYPVNQVLASGKELRHFIAGIHRLQAGEDVWVQVEAVPVLNETGEIIQVVMTLIDITERKQAEVKLLGSEQLLQALVENSSDIIIRYDLQYRRTYVNNAAQALFTSSKQSILGKTPLDQSPLDDPGSYIRHLQQAIEAGENSMELLFRSTEGEMRWTYIRFIPELDASNRVVSVITIGRDIHDIKKNEQSFRMLAENFPDYVIRLKHDGRLSYVNPAFEQRFGLSAESLIGKTMQQLPLLSNQEQNQAFVALKQRIFEEGTDFQSEIRWNTAEGEYLFEFRYVPEKDDLGNVVSILCIARDITERKHNEQQLSLYNFALNKMHDEAILIDEQARILYANDQACRGLKYTREELLKLTIADIDIVYQEKNWSEMVRNAKDQGSISIRGIHLTSEGLEYPVEISASYFHYDQQAYIFGLSRDITDRNHAEQEMLRINRFLRTLSSCNEILIHAENEVELFQDMCRVMVEVGEFAQAWVGLKNKAQTLQIKAYFGSILEGMFDTDTLIDITKPVHLCTPAIRAVRTGKVQVVKNSVKDSCLQWQRQAVKTGYQSAIALPLKNGKEIIGVLNIYSLEEDSFGNEESSLLTDLANDLSFGINTLLVRIEREHFVTQLQGSIEATILALASTVELRDPYTAGHQRRVASLSTEIARLANFSEEQVQVINLAGVIHDIGKISIPAEILSKPGRLSDIEMALVRTHAAAGYEILKNINFPWPIADIVRQHHERVDGSGYPDGLKGEDILIEARILAVADVVEAMTTHRPYRPGLGIDAALAELQDGRNTRYDADIVDLCIKLFHEQAYVFE